MEKRYDTYNGYRDLKVYQPAYTLAMDVFQITKTFPKDEKYSLIDQIRRSTRSIPANIAEACKIRRYPKSFVSKIVDAAGEAGETEVWLDVSRDAGYLQAGKYEEFIAGYAEVNRMLYGVIAKHEKFTNAAGNRPQEVQNTQ